MLVQRKSKIVSQKGNRIWRAKEKNVQLKIISRRIGSLISIRVAISKLKDCQRRPTVINSIFIRKQNKYQ